MLEQVEMLFKWVAVMAIAIAGLIMMADWLAGPGF